MAELFVTKEFDFSSVARLKISEGEEILQGHNYEFRITAPVGNLSYGRF